MALKETTSAAIWIGLSEGKFYIGKKGDSDKRFPAFEGLLAGISFRDSDYQGVTRRDVVLLFIDDGKKYKISMSVSSGYGKQLLMKLPNCDVSQPIELCPTYEEKDGAKKAGMFVNQMSGSIKQLWTKDNPGNLPQVVSMGVIKGKEVWDDSKQCEWLEDYIMKNVAPACMKNAAAQSLNSSANEGDDGCSGIPEDNEPPAKHPDGEVPF